MHNLTSTVIRFAIITALVGWTIGSGRETTGADSTEAELHFRNTNPLPPLPEPIPPPYEATKEYELKLEKYREAIKEYQASVKVWKGDVGKRVREPIAQAEEEDQRTTKELDELTKEPGFNPGDEVVALRETELMVEAKAVGTVRKGEKLTVEDVQANWFWVRSGATRGWIGNESVLGADVLAFYDRLSDNSSTTEEKSRRTRGKLHGVLLEVVTAGPGVVIVTDTSLALPHGVVLEDVTFPEAITITGSGVANVNTTFTFEGINGDNKVRVPDGLLYDSVNIQVGKAADGRRALRIRFPGARELPPPPPGRLYGTVEQRDYVFIDTKARQVSVNGQLRRPSR